jgi:glutaredoxin
LIAPMPAPSVGRQRLWRNLGLTCITALLVGGLSGTSDPLQAAGSDASAVGEAVSPSTPEQMALVEHLRRQGAVVYGAWWCPHCFSQKNLFGTEAGRRLPYIECDKDDNGRQRCQAAKIRSFPTWDLNGERREGVLSLEELRVWSGFSSNSATVSPALK